MFLGLSPVIWGVLGVVAGGTSLAYGADRLVGSTVALARGLGVPAMVVAMSVLAFGTSLPEVLVSARASAGGAMGIALGNIVGSNIANTLLILGATALLAPLACRGHGLKRDSLAMLAATALFILACAHPGATLARWVGAALLAALAGYIGLRYWAGRNDPAEDPTQEMPEATEATLGRACLVTVAALAGVLLGAEAFVRGAETIARALGVTDTVIGLTVVALGTSLPELATGVASARQGKPEVMVGGVVGSNLFNLLVVTGVAALVAPIVVPPAIQGPALAALAGITLLLTGLVLGGARIGRPLAGLFLAGYALFIAAQALGAANVPLAAG